jgi:hypothetical protein
MRVCGDRTQRHQHEGYRGLTRIPGVSRRSFAIGLAALGCEIPIVPSANSQSARVRRIGLALALPTALAARATNPAMPLVIVTGPGFWSAANIPAATRPASMSCRLV